MTGTEQDRRWQGHVQSREIRSTPQNSSKNIHLERRAKIASAFCRCFASALMVRLLLQGQPGVKDCAARPQDREQGARRRQVARQYDNGIQRDYPLKCRWQDAALREHLVGSLAATWTHMTQRALNFVRVVRKRPVIGCQFQYRPHFAAPCHSSQTIEA